MLFSSLTDIMDKELHLYLEMKNLHAQKKDILIKNDLSNLAIIDKKILQNLKSIKNIQEIIKQTSIQLPQEHKEKLTKLAKEIYTINQTNMELIKHGIVMADKKLHIIINACTSNNTVYSKYGKEKHQNITMSTIIQDI